MSDVEGDAMFGIGFCVVVALFMIFVALPWDSWAAARRKRRRLAEEDSRHRLEDDMSTGMLARVTAENERKDAEEALPAEPAMSEAERARAEVEAVAAMRRCPNPSYGGIGCPFALSDDSPLPCYGTDEQCAAWRKRVAAIMAMNEESDPVELGSGI